MVSPFHPEQPESFTANHLSLWLSRMLFSPPGCVISKTMQKNSASSRSVSLPD